MGCLAGCTFSFTLRDCSFLKLHIIWSWADLIVPACTSGNVVQLYLHRVDSHPPCIDAIVTFVFHTYSLLHFTTLTHNQFSSPYPWLLFFWNCFFHFFCLSPFFPLNFLLFSFVFFSQPIICFIYTSSISFSLSLCCVQQISSFSSFIQLSSSHSPSTSSPPDLRPPGPC